MEMGRFKCGPAILKITQTLKPSRAQLGQFLSFFRQGNISWACPGLSASLLHCFPDYMVLLTDKYGPGNRLDDMKSRLHHHPQTTDRAVLGCQGRKALVCK